MKISSCNDERNPRLLKTEARTASVGWEVTVFLLTELK